MKTLSAILSLLITWIFTIPLSGQIIVSGTNPTAAEVIESIIRKTGSARIPNTVDVIKEGDPETKVTGIVTTMFATMEVLRKAVELKCNLIVVHEPLYYNHRDETQQFGKDPVFLEKKKFINDNKLVIWRFHDYIHSAKPDGIMLGMIVKLGWKNNVTEGDFSRFVIPETTLNGLLKRLKVIFPKNAFYVIGKPDMKITRVKLSPGAPGSQSHIASLNDDNIDVLIAGEASQWETYEYARDAVSQGRKKAVIFLGHVASEEAGMDFCAGWFKDFIRDIPVFFVESAPSYWSY
jgi:putative NIF3 family GTP cyclohydrolase 1 type 2